MLALLALSLLGQAPGIQCGVSGVPFSQGSSGTGTTTGAGLYVKLAAYYSMTYDGGLGVGVIPDQQGANNPTISGTVSVTPDAGIIGQGFGCLDTNNSLNTAFQTQLPIGPEFSVSMWIRPVDPLPTPYGALLAESSFLGIFITSGGVGLGKIDVYFAADHFSGTFPLGTWRHVVITGSQSGVKSYLNGVFDATLSATPFPGMKYQYMGYDGFDQFKGDIDEVGIWTRPLTPAEVTYLYNAGAGRTVPFQ